MLDLVGRDPNEGEREKIRASMGLQDLDDQDVERWRRTIRDSMTVTVGRFQGMIHVTYEFVEGRLDGVIHLTDWEDKSAKPDSAVLSREANVHNVPIAADPYTARAHPFDLNIWWNLSIWRDRCWKGRQVHPALLSLTGRHVSVRF